MTCTCPTESQIKLAGTLIWECAEHRPPPCTCPKSGPIRQRHLNCPVHAQVGEGLYDAPPRGPEADRLAALRATLEETERQVRDLRAECERYAEGRRQLRSRIPSARATAAIHPDPLARARAEGRAQAYRVAVELLEAGR